MSDPLPEAVEPELVADDGPHCILIQFVPAGDDEVELELTTVGAGDKQSVIDLLQMTIEQLQTQD